jgi:endonuclease YncB( thermonuclease family)
MIYLLIAIAIWIFWQWRSYKTKLPQLPYTCVKHIDGDTSDYRDLQGEIRRVRYEFMDADESKQPFGSYATQRLTQLVPIGSQVNLRFNGKDRYNRDIVTVETHTLNINYEMVATGYAVSETNYKGDRATKNQYIAAEKYAESHRLGRWSRHEWCAERPSEYRDRIRMEQNGSQRPIKRSKNNSRGK